MTGRLSRRVLIALGVAIALPSLAAAQDNGTVREQLRARRQARREARAEQNPDDRNKALAERQRVENTLREALAQAVRQRLNLNDQQATRLMEVNRRFSEDRIRVARDEIRIRRDLRLSLNGRDSSRSPETGRLLDELLDTQRQRLDVQQREQAALSEFLTPEQRARYIGMMEQLRRRIQQRADSARAIADPPEE